MPTDDAAGGWLPPGELADPHWSGLPRGARVLFGLGLRAWTLSPWVVLACAGAAVGLHRWPGPLGQASAGLCVAAAWAGWSLLWRASGRGVDVDVAALLRAAVPEPEPWALFPQSEERTLAMHTHACLVRWGVSPRSSGWERLSRRARGWWWQDAAVAALLCVPLTVHPWWVTW